jgi:D-amino-acid oxidase
MRVLVVGAGVIGLTVGVRLAEAGHAVNVVARELPLETTSAVAAALWYPYRIQPLDRVLAWSESSLAEFGKIAAVDPDAGVRLRTGTELLRSQVPEPWWAGVVPDLVRLDRVPPPYRDGWSFSAPVIEMPIYLDWLTSRLHAAGGTLTRMALPALPSHAELVVNCAGLGAVGLARDTAMRPVRGQVLLLEQVGLESWLLDGGGLTYVVPRSHDIVVGGTDVEGEWDRRPDPKVASEILDRAVALMPELAGADVLAHRVGLRPGRSEVRLEAERSAAGGTVIHCYGHGGAGVTVSWGCADDVAELVEATIATG